MREKWYNSESRPCLKDGVLHIDGDKHYLDMCLKNIEELNINLQWLFYERKWEIKDQIIQLIEKHRPIYWW